MTLMVGEMHQTRVPTLYLPAERESVLSTPAADRAKSALHGDDGMVHPPRRYLPAPHPIKLGKIIEGPHGRW